MREREELLSTAERSFRDSWVISSNSRWNLVLTCEGSVLKRHNSFGENFGKEEQLEANRESLVTSEWDQAIPP